jgi:Rrf2 family transcriptional regulator, cysteine metabolism repressor
MKLSRTVTYAIQATVELGAAGPGAIVPSRKLAEAGRIPDRFLLQILRNLVSHGILQSTRGVVGGYALARGLDRISLLDIVEAIEGPVKLELPVSAADQDRRESVALQQALLKVSAAVRRELDEFKLSQLTVDRSPG